MTKLSVTYRALIFTLLCCIFTQSISFASNNESEVIKTEQQDADQDTFIQAAHTEAVIPASTFQLVKWNYLVEIFSYEIIKNTVLHIEHLHLVLSYFQVLFEVCITTNAP